jgi:hypothetical protein
LRIKHHVCRIAEGHEKVGRDASRIVNEELRISAITLLTHIIHLLWICLLLPIQIAPHITPREDMIRARIRRQLGLEPTEASIGNLHAVAGLEEVAEEADRGIPGKRSDFRELYMSGMILANQY